jgi:Double zinc ribbon/PEGA domain
MKYCPKCMVDLTGSDRFCKLCGGHSAEKPDPEASGLICPGCGTKARPTWKVCTRCGQRLQAAGEVRASAVICNICSKANRTGVKFCEGCGNSLDVQQAGSVSGGGLGAQPAPYDPEATRRSVFDPDALDQTAAVTPVPCARCGAAVRAGLPYCEVCGTPVGYIDQPRQGLKWLLITAAALVVLGGVIAGWHFWGVRLTITVNADQPGSAQVFLDNQEMGKTEGQMTLNHLARGKYKIRVERAGYEKYESDVELGVTEFSKTIEVPLSRSKYVLTVTGATRDSEVFLDGTLLGEWDAGRSEWVIKDIVGGTQHALLVKRPGYRDFKKDVTLSGARSEKVDWVVSANGDWSGTYWESFTDAAAYMQFTLSATDAPGGSVDRSEFSGTLTVTNAFPVQIITRITNAYINTRDKTLSFKASLSGDVATFIGKIDTDLRQVSGRWVPSGPGLGGEWNMSRSLPVRGSASLF